LPTCYNIMFYFFDSSEVRRWKECHEASHPYLHIWMFTRAEGIYELSDILDNDLSGTFVSEKAFWR
jgi:plasmid rolling circle replication initiator protein Rep